MIVRHATADDANTITALNEVFVSVTSPMDGERFRELFALSSFCLVAEAPNEVLGFVMAMTNGAPYHNGNYKWFDDRVSDMVYVDRIVLASDGEGPRGWQGALQIPIRACSGCWLQCDDRGDGYRSTQCTLCPLPPHAWLC
jgi:predicted GNAT superfamily acetyltransferase